MDFRRLRHFVGVSEIGSLSQASKRLHVVQPALTQSIKNLEEDLGVILFIRSRKGMELTEAGQLFLQSAYGILNQYSRTKEDLAAIGSEPAGLVSMAMTASTLNALSARLCKKIVKNYPNIEFNLEEGLAANIQQGFEAGWYDLMVSHLHTDEAAVHEVELIDEELYLVSAAGGARDLEDIPFNELKSYPLIIPQEQHGVRHALNDMAQKHDEDINFSKFTAAMHPTLNLVEQGLGHSLLPWSAIFNLISEGKLSARKVIHPEITHRVSLIYPKTRPLTQASLAVIELLKQTLLEANADGHWPGKVLF